VPEPMVPEAMVLESRLDERGTITLWVLGLCVALMFLGGLSLDLWRAVADRRQLSSMADTAATAAANGIDVDALRAGTLRLDPIRARAIALASLDEDPHSSALDAIDVEIVGNRVTVSLRDHVPFSLLGIFMGGQHFDIQVHATAQPEERS
jgi:Flp pilus assembly protein TadG